MSRFAQTMFSKIAKKHPAIAWVDDHIAALNLAFFILLFMIGVAYIVQINNTVAKGYEMRELEDKIHALTLENQRMEVQVRKQRSLEHVSRNVKMLGLVPAETADYVEASAPAYALAD